MPAAQTFRGTFVDTPRLGELRICEDYVLAVDEHGFITHFAPSTSTTLPTPTTTLPRGTFLLPTFLDLHLHAPQYLSLGTGLDLPLMQWLDAYTYRSEERLDAEEGLARRVYSRLARRLVEGGTGGVSVFGTINPRTNEILAECMAEAGIRARVGKLSMDISTRPTYVESSIESSLSAALSFAQSIRASYPPTPSSSTITTSSTFPPPSSVISTSNATTQIPPLIEPVLTPRFVPTCTDALLAGLGHLSSAHGLHVQSHLAEANDQVAWVRETRGGREDIDVFDKAGLLGPRTHQAHCTFLSTPSSNHAAAAAAAAVPSDMERLARRGTAIAHCPLSNLYFSERPFALREALRAGVKVGLGTDVAGGYSVDMMSAMRTAVGVSRARAGERKLQQNSIQGHGESTEDGGAGDEGEESLAITWVESLYLATRGGALALGGSYENVGVFEVGRVFDAQQSRGVGSLDFFDVEDAFERGSGDGAGTRITQEMVEKWWCGGDVRNRRGVWVQGRRVYSG